MTPGIRIKRGQSLASTVSERLGLVHFIKDWNDGGGSIINDYEGFELAVMLDHDLRAAYEEAQAGAERDGLLVEFRAALRLTLARTIHQTSELALWVVATLWARTFVALDPAAFGGPAPFDDIDALAQWCAGHPEGPILADPYGGELVSTRRRVGLIADALLEESAAAMKAGWILDNTVRKRSVPLPVYKAVKSPQPPVA